MAEMEIKWFLIISNTCTLRLNQEVDVSLKAWSWAHSHDYFVSGVFRWDASILTALPSNTKAKA